MAAATFAGPAAGGAIGFGVTFRRIATVARGFRDSRLMVGSYAVVAAALAILLGAVLPLVRPTSLWLWFIAYHAADAIVRFMWLARRGVPVTRRGTVRRVAIMAVGAVAVAWADAHERS